MAENNSTPLERHSIIWIGLLVGIGFYVIDVIVDVVVSGRGSFIEILLNPTYHDIWTRMAVLIVAVGFASYVQILLRREHKISEAAKTAERFLNSVFDNIPGMVFIKDAKYLRFIRINHAGEELLGLSSHELMGKNDYDFFPESQAEFFIRKDHEVLESGVTVDISEEEIDTATQGKRWLHTRKTPILDDEGKPIYLLGISEDITETKHAKEKLQRQQREMAHISRLSTMGEMASGIAHELNQPLTALTSYCGTAATLVKDLSSPPQQLGEILGRAEEQAYRASRIISHLRDFLSNTNDNKEAVDIGQVIEGAIDFIKPELKDGSVKIEYLPGVRGCKVMASRIQIEQVLVNLMLNSIQAIHSLEKATGNISVQTRLLPNEMIETTVTDNGPGIDAGMVKRMFNPFQTSKSSGMGMGLSISRSIVEESGGKLWADKQRANGALFGFSLPVCE